MATASLGPTKKRPASERSSQSSSPSSAGPVTSSPHGHQDFAFGPKGLARSCQQACPGAVSDKGGGKVSASTYEVLAVVKEDKRLSP